MKTIIGLTIIIFLGLLYPQLDGTPSTTFKETGCIKCGIPADGDYNKFHTTMYDKYGGVTFMCDKCFNSCTIVERSTYYMRFINRYWMPDYRSMTYEQQKSFKQKVSLVMDAVTDGK